MRNKLTALFLALTICVVGCSEEYGEPNADTAANTSGTTSAASETSFAVTESDEVSDALPSLYIGDGEEAAERLQLGTGFEEYAGTGEYDPDLIANGGVKSARALRRIQKQDVYGRILPDSYYFYRSMLNANEQKLYDQIYANAVELDDRFEFASKVHYSRVDTVFMSVRFDNPDLFWLSTSYGYSYDNSGNITSMKLGFYDVVGNIEAFRKVFFDVIDSIAEVAMTLDNDVERVKYCHDMLTNINTYNLNEPMNQSAYSALCKGQTVCAGFSHAFNMLMQRLGIESTVVLGNAYYPGPVNAGLHLWNLVGLYGEYYEMDVTWDNYDTYPYTDPNTYSYDYFNIPTSAISGDHVRVAPSTGLPTAYGTKYSYKSFYGNKPGSDFTTISFGKPKTKLPPLYAASGTTSSTSNVDYTIPAQSEIPPAIPDYEEDDYEIDWDYYDEVECWLENMSDEEWDALWNIFYETLDEDSYEELDEMDWDEFVEYMVWLMYSE